MKPCYKKGIIFNEQAIVELTIAIGYYGMLARLLIPLQVEVDEISAGSASELIGRRGDKSQNSKVNTG